MELLRYFLPKLMRLINNYRIYEKLYESYVKYFYGYLPVAASVATNRHPTV